MNCSYVNNYKRVIIMAITNLYEFDDSDNLDYIVTEIDFEFDDMQLHSITLLGPNPDGMYSVQYATQNLQVFAKLDYETTESLVTLFREGREISYMERSREKNEMVTNWKSMFFPLAETLFDFSVVNGPIDIDKYRNEPPSGTKLN